MILDNEWVWNEKAGIMSDGDWEKGEKLDGFNTKRINWRWLVRVFCWRFLEISSRICIFTLIWLNLGGLTVFIILLVELLYLVMLCAVCRKLGVI